MKFEEFGLSHPILNALSEKIVVLIELSNTIAKQKRTMVVELTLFANMFGTSENSKGGY